MGPPRLKSCTRAYTRVCRHIHRFFRRSRERRLSRLMFGSLRHHPLHRKTSIFMYPLQCVSEFTLTGGPYRNLTEAHGRKYYTHPYRRPSRFLTSTEYQRPQHHFFECPYGQTLRNASGNTTAKGAATILRATLPEPYGEPTAKAISGTMVNK